MFLKRRGALLSLYAFSILALSLPAFAQSDQTQNPLRQLHFRPLGPIGNRAASIVGEPGNPLVMYVGAAAGGIFKTDDGGVTWHPVFDEQDVAAVGALAISPAQHNDGLGWNGRALANSAVLSAGRWCL